MKPIDITEPPGFYTYRNGEPARILCTDAAGEHPVRSLADDGSTFSHYANGSVGGPTNALDLIESRPEPREFELCSNGFRTIKGGGVLDGERIIVREIPPTVAEKPAPEFPTVGTRLRMTKRNFHGVLRPVGHELIVTKIDGPYQFRATEGGEFGGEFLFDGDWRDGLELLPPLSEPQDPEESRAKAALTSLWLWWGKRPLEECVSNKLTADVARWDGEKWDKTGWSGSSDGLIYAIRAGSDLARRNGLEPSLEWRELDEWDGEAYEENGVWWRNLGRKTEIKNGDEVQRHAARWIPAVDSIGLTIAQREIEGEDLRARRKVNTEAGIQRWRHAPGVMCQAEEGAWVRYTDHLAALKQAGKGSV